MRVSGEKLLQSILGVVAAAALVAAAAGDAIEIKQAPSAAPHKVGADAADNPRAVGGDPYPRAALLPTVSP
jgi:hypothetical protein